MSAPRILLVDDESSLRKGYRAVLVGEGYEVITARSAEEGVAKCAEVHPDLVLLDIMMPEGNGYQAFKQLKAIDARLPILFLTALDGEVDVVRGLDLGADDFISKSTPTAAFLARVRRALARKTEQERDALAGRQIQLGRVTVDLGALTVSMPDAPTQILTASEVNILRLLATERGRYFTPDEIFTALHGADYSGDATAVRIFICHLREKLGPAGDMIVSQRGCGYALLG